MANGWTPERRAHQAELIRQWLPWEKATGPRRGILQATPKEASLISESIGEDDPKNPTCVYEPTQRSNRSHANGRFQRRKGLKQVGFTQGQIAVDGPKHHGYTGI